MYRSIVRRNLIQSLLSSNVARRKTAFSFSQYSSIRTMGSSSSSQSQLENNNVNNNKKEPISKKKFEAYDNKGMEKQMSKQAPPQMNLSQIKLETPEHIQKEPIWRSEEKQRPMGRNQRDVLQKNQHVEASSNAASVDPIWNAAQRRGYCTKRPEQARSYDSGHSESAETKTGSSSAMEHHHKKEATGESSKKQVKSGKNVDDPSQNNAKEDVSSSNLQSAAMFGQPGAVGSSDSLSSSSSVSSTPPRSFGGAGAAGIAGTSGAQASNMMNKNVHPQTAQTSTPMESNKQQKRSKTTIPSEQHHVEERPAAGTFIPGISSANRHSTDSTTSWSGSTSNEGGSYGSPAASSYEQSDLALKKDNQQLDGSGSSKPSEQQFYKSPSALEQEYTEAGIPGYQKITPKIVLQSAEHVMNMDREAYMPRAASSSSSIGQSVDPSKPLKYDDEASYNARKGGEREYHPRDESIHHSGSSEFDKELNSNRNKPAEQHFYGSPTGSSAAPQPKASASSSNKPAKESARPTASKSVDKTTEMKEADPYLSAASERMGVMKSVLEKAKGSWESVKNSDGKNTSSARFGGDSSSGHQM